MSYCVCVCGQYFWFEMTCEIPVFVNALKVSSLNHLRSPLIMTFHQRSHLSRGKAAGCCQLYTRCQSFQRLGRSKQYDETDNGGFFLVNNTVSFLLLSYSYGFDGSFSFAAEMTSELVLGFLIRV
ncbi:hypothetical protein CK203_089686 [Vitis vinifera]|uniref:Uncharacterized protein n=1 Tax=Vitis vinifera TaxID=29760 RepID=A0A438EI00_VITVI|nr:hypothetical protein CK203_089686 [Vitis vinifera]